MTSQLSRRCVRSNLEQVCSGRTSHDTGYTFTSGPSRMSHALRTATNKHRVDCSSLENGGISACRRHYFFTRAHRAASSARSQELSDLCEFAYWWSDAVPGHRLSTSCQVNGRSRRVAQLIYGSSIQIAARYVVSSRAATGQQHDSAVVSMTRCSYTAVTAKSVCSDHELTDTCLQSENDFKQRWNFDVSKEQPVPGRWKYDPGRQSPD